MATKKGSDNRFPLLRLTYEDDTPSTPPADEGHLVAGVDKVLRWIDDDGTVTELGAGTSLAPGTDPGDLLVWDGADWVPLPVGADGDVITADSGETLGLAYTTPSVGGGGDLEYITETVVAGSTAADITITGIPNTYRDLVLVVRARTVAGADFDTLLLRCGDGAIDTGNNYSSLRVIHGSGSANLGGRTQSSINLLTVPGSTATAGSFAMARFDFMGYADTSMFKVIEGQGYHDGATDHYYSSMGGMYRSSSAEVDQLRIYSGSNNLAIGSRLTVYGRN